MNMSVNNPEAISGHRIVASVCPVVKPIKCYNIQRYDVTTMCDSTTTVRSSVRLVERGNHAGVEHVNTHTHTGERKGTFNCPCTHCSV